MGEMVIRIRHFLGGLKVSKSFWHEMSAKFVAIQTEVVSVNDSRVFCFHFPIYTVISPPEKGLF